MLLLASKALFVLVAALLTLATLTSARDMLGGSIEIVKPKAGYVVAPRNPATYSRGDTTEMHFTLKGDSDFNGKANVTLIKRKKKIEIQIAKEIPVTRSEADAPITILLSNFTSGNYTLKAILYNKNGIFEELTQGVLVKLPKQQQAQGQDDPSVESPSSTSTADSEETGSADGEPARRANGSGIARGK